MMIKILMHSSTESNEDKNLPSNSLSPLSDLCLVFIFLIIFSFINCRVFIHVKVNFYQHRPNQFLTGFKA